MNKEVRIKQQDIYFREKERYLEKRKERCREYQARKRMVEQAARQIV